MLLLLSWTCVTAALISTVSCAQNPILSGFNPDPSVIRVDDWYYLATSSFEYFPGVPLYRSRDLVNWELFSHALSRPEDVQLYGTPTGAGVWAPSLSYFNSTFYLASMTRWTYDPVARVWPRVYWTSSKDLIAWEPVTWGEPWGIDPSLFHDHVSGKTYLNLMSPNNNVERIWGLYLCEVDVISGKCVGTYRSLWNGTLEHNSTARDEGPKMSFREGWYYLLAAEGGTDLLHRSTIARSKSPEGPWEPNPSNPILYSGNSIYNSPKNLTVQSTGHGTFVDTPDGDSYLVYLARRDIAGSSPLGRETFISAVKWTDEGWPVVNDGKPVLLSEKIPGLPEIDASKRPTKVRHLFQGKKLELGWYTLRTPYTSVYSLGETPTGSCSGSPGSGIQLNPNVFSLSDRDVPAAIFHKQTSLNMSFSAQTFTLPTQGLGWRQTIGVSAYLSEQVHHDIGFTACRNTTGASCVYTSLWRNGTEQYTEAPISLGSHTSIIFTIRAEPDRYKLGFALSRRDEEDPTTTWLAEFGACWMAWAPTGWFVFDGAMFALFASGGGLPWTASGPAVGFCSAQEEFFGEDIPDYSEGWNTTGCPGPLD